MSDEEDEDETPSRLIKDAYDLQRMKLEKLMKNPTKPVVIPDRPKDKKSLFVPDFVRNVMGSSAGAGSGEFHVYRHLRRKEYGRQKLISEMSERERLDMEFQEKLAENQRKAEERTAKKRQKRLKKKAKQKEKRKKAKLMPSKKEESSSESESNSDEETEKVEKLSDCDGDATNVSESEADKTSKNTNNSDKD